MDRLAREYLPVMQVMVHAVGADMNASGAHDHKARHNPGAFSKAIFLKEFSNDGIVLRGERHCLSKLEAKLRCLHQPFQLLIIRDQVIYPNAGNW